MTSKNLRMRAIYWLQKKAKRFDPIAHKAVVGNRECPMCGTAGLTGPSRFLMVPLSAEDLFSVKDSARTPALDPAEHRALAAFTCNTCAHVMLFDAIQMGLTPERFDPAGNPSSAPATPPRGRGKR